MEATHKGSLRNPKVENQKISWNDSSIQSLTSPFSDPLQGEEADNLTKKIKWGMIEAFDKCGEENDLIERLSLIDCLLCLGIDRLFQEEITRDLDYVYMKAWNSNSGIGDGTKSPKANIVSTALAFKLLRLHRYQNVSPDVFSQFQNGSGHGFLEEETSSSLFTSTSVVKALNLLRASYLQFNGETILEEAQRSCTSFLNSFISLQQNITQSKYDFARLKQEVEHTLQYQWILTTPRWEARRFIDFYSTNKDWLSHTLNLKIIQLAKLDYNIVQAKLQEDLKEISRWWNNTEISKLSNFKDGLVRSFLMTACGIYEPELSGVRILTTKGCLGGYILDDIYDKFASQEKLPVIIRAMQELKLDVNNGHCLKEHIITGCQFYLDANIQIMTELNNIQGVDTQKYVHQRIMGWAHASEQEAIWKFQGYVPTFEGYMRQGMESPGMLPLFLVAKLRFCSGFPLADLERRPHGISTFDKLCALSCRLIDDIHDFAEEKEQGFNISAVESYAKDNPECTLEEVVAFLRAMTQGFMKNIVQHYFNTHMASEESQMPEDSFYFKRTTLEMTRTFNFFYSYGDGFGHLNDGLINQIDAILFQPIL